MKKTVIKFLLLIFTGLFLINSVNASTPQINNLLRYRSIVFKDSFTTTYSPASSPLTNFYNKWNYMASQTGDYPYLSNSFTANTHTYTAQINRNRENYKLSRAIDISYSFYHQFTGGGYGGSSSVHEVSIGGNPSALMGYLPGYYYPSTPFYNGITVWGSHNWAASSVTLRISNNRTNIATIGTYAPNTTWYVFLKIRGNTIYYAVNSTGATPTSYSSATITDKTVDSNSLVMAIASSYGPDNTAGVITLDNLKVTLY